MDTAPTSKPHRTYAYHDLEFLIQEGPSILGEKTTITGTLSAIRSGGAGFSVASSDDHHEHIIKRLDKISKVRRLYKVWQALDSHTRFVLDIYYTPRVVWPAGYAAHIGPEFASVTLAFGPPGLPDAVQQANKPGHQALIAKAISNARELVAEAHQTWDRVRRIVDPPPQKEAPLRGLARLAQEEGFA